LSTEGTNDRLVPDALAQTSVTTTVAGRVKPGHEVFYESFLKGIIAAAAQFPGHLGVEVFRPTAAADGDYRVVYRFDTVEHLQAWLDSDERATWLARAEPHVIGPIRTRILTGLEAWFTLAHRPDLAPPARYKMAILTWAAIFPLSTLMVRVGDPFLTQLSFVPRLGVTTAATVALMTWLVMPRVTRLLRRWLYPDLGANPTSEKPRVAGEPGILWRDHRGYALCTDPIADRNGADPTSRNESDVPMSSRAAGGEHDHQPQT
jgi:uncharacterized protein